MRNDNQAKTKKAIPNMAVRFGNVWAATDRCSTIQTDGMADTDRNPQGNYQFS